VSFLPSRLLLLYLAGLVPVAMFAASWDWGQGLVVAVAAALLAGFFRHGIGGAGGADVEVCREMPLALSVGERADICLRVRNRSEKTLVVQVADGCPVQLQPLAERLSVTLSAHEEQTIRYQVCPAERGVHSFCELHLWLRTPAGLAERSVLVDLGGEARVHPNLREIGRYQMRARRDLLRLGGARRTRVLARQGDFERLRDFVTGDDVRHLDWKATARLHRPITRIFQAERSQTLLILVDGTRLMAGRAGELTKMDYAVNAALMLAHVGLSRGDRVGVAVFDQGLRNYLPPRSGHAQFSRVLNLLFDQQATRSFPRYREAARQLVRDNRRRSLLVWITDLVDGEQGQELVSALRSLRRRHLSLVVALTDPALAELAQHVPANPRDLFAVTAATEVLSDRDALVGRLCAEGAEIVSRVPDRIGPALVEQYLDIKQRGRL
jgi:uncharacterized protein (DUF58 family)